MVSGQRNYLEEYDATPDNQKYPLVRRWMKTEPLPFFGSFASSVPSW